ncbi:MAG: LamG domain-containing protein [Planctomycetes bacterium]|nr:LamG domain-containing protein [Planctomycetota bacterium]
MCKKLIFPISFVLLLGLVLSSVVKASDPDLAAHWKFDDGFGDVAFDISGNGNDGTIHGATWVEEGKINSALSFDRGDFVEVPHSESLSITKEITVMAWSNCTDVSENPTVVGKGSGDPTVHFELSLQGGGIYWQFKYTDSWVECIMSPLPTLGEWHHIAGTFDGETGTFKFYLDGELGVELESSRKDLPENELPVTIGKRINPEGRFMRGMIDDVRIYSRALTADEIQVIMLGLGDYPTASSPTPANGALHADTWANISWRPGSYAVSHDVYLGDNYDAVNEGAEGTFLGNQTDTFIIAGFPGFAYPEGLVPGTTYYWRIDEANDSEPNSPWKGDVWSFGIPPKTAYYPDPADAAEAVSVDVQLGWTAGFGAKLHTVYFGDNFDDVSNAAGGSSQGTTTYSPGTLKMANTYYWRVDEFDVTEIHKGNVWSFTTEGAVAALNPANGVVDITQTPVLTWTPGLGASHEVYFGTDAGSLENKASGNLGSESFDPGQLEWNTTYYWRVDEADNANADSPWTGPLWSFTTANFLIIDDMESYNDLDEGEPGSNRIYLAWIDGFDNPATNGSVVGNFDPPFAEQSIVHGGNQSMPFEYNNAVGKSEATLTLTSNKDWTVNGVDTLTIWYIGGSGNDSEQMYVTLNGSATVDNEDTDAANVFTWTKWNIPLQAFADQDVDLANVTSITIGLRSGSSGTGMMYFDDIRLYPPAP